MQSSMMSIFFLIVIVLAMYLLMIRPQRKREKETNAMRAGLQVGDEIVTIGGICAKIVKTKDETIVVQVGADKTKMEMMRWSVSKVVKESPKRARTVEVEEEVEEVKKPKRLRKAAPVEDEPVVAEVVEEAEEAEETVTEE